VTEELLHMDPGSRQFKLCCEGRGHTVRIAVRSILLPVHHHNNNHTKNYNYAHPSPSGCHRPRLLQPHLPGRTLHRGGGLLPVGPLVAVSDGGIVSAPCWVSASRPLIQPPSLKRCTFAEDSIRELSKIEYYCWIRGLRVAGGRGRKCRNKS
jgi:hypothetical protein